MLQYIASEEKTYEERYVEAITQIPLYTDEEEINKQPTANIHVNMPIYDVVASGIHSDRADGIVINPFGLALVVPKEILEIVVKRVDELKQAGKKEQKDEPEIAKRPEHSGFEAPTIGTALPEKMVIKRNPDGTISIKDEE